MTQSPTSPDAVRAVTRERLRLLSLGYYISGAIGALFVSILLFHFIFLLILSFVPESAWNNPHGRQQTVSQNEPGSPPETKKQNGPAPVIIFRVMAGIVGVIILGGWTLGGLTIYAGRCLARREKKTFVLVMAGVNCIWIPYGTLLGVGTFLALSTPDAKEEYPA
jgi:hypothetical protein